ncbi:MULTISPECIES: ArnT family glycosyltransferase [unclassified Haematospirillum]|uniref:ArnT family glycosyltransferase n=1 Tax=unclassified Haematospirillum TaxID=2622088 RepID=UPI0014386F8D|nr:MULTISPECIES: glycosyltransferase family 39 protein [unclassified Haematospirillum]NKD55610.1 phospholipid carrier-dependent glycosyltransferase [Haematospirillum sp. H4890]NKD75749.1 phospholipid carrier-dependent glycosyltransferase [Haematospirillum sp. H4485]NKD88259.1 phospholipid carrier-dependent glycosyltransferase [Haematospirillum sp. 15-248]
MTRESCCRNGWSSPAFRVALTVVLAVTVWRLFQLFGTPVNLSFDEAQYWSWSTDPAFGYFSKPPFIAWVIALTTSLGGDSEPWVRIGATLAHAVTALLVYGVGFVLFDRDHADDNAGRRVVGVWSAVIYITLPAVSLSSMLVSTDAFLLMFWALSLLGLACIVTGGSAWWWLAVGLGLGFGLLSKYAMVFFIVSVVLALLWHAPWRRFLRSPGLWGALVLGAAFYAPNIWWNLAHGMASYRHTGDNVNLGVDVFNPLNMVAFLASQAGVFGPLLLAVLVLALCVPARSRLHVDWRFRFLAAFVVPVLVIMSVQALISRANANWAAPAFVAAVPLVVSWCLGTGSRAWVLRASIVLHVLVASLVYNADSLAAAFGVRVPPALDLQKRVRGWDDAGRWVRELKAQNPERPLLFDDRKTMATLLYYARPLAWDSFMWHPGDVVHNHYELTMPLPDVPGGRFLYVTRHDPSVLYQRFQSVEPVAVFRSAGVAGGTLELSAWYVDHFLGYGP